GQDPAYWALVEGDAAHAGITIHLVDEGVDTGDVLYQDKVDLSDSGNITSYPHRQVATALPLFRRAIEDAINGRLAPQKVDLPSRKWFPPTLWAYLWNGLSRGVW
ncbi:MAG: formyltransferase family protein, partial [Alphaproteobacteria bacterium]|nr:formyltransferase family protein [Alphaproteobacteria bacterium]